MRWKNYQVIFFDLGDTLIFQEIDSHCSLDQLDIKLLPSAKEVLTYASKKCEIGIITNTEITTGSAVWRLMTKHDIAHLIQSITTSVDVGLKKPHKQLFLMALAKHHVEPLKCIMIGNNYEEDIVPAKELGMTTVLIRSQSDQQFILADYVVPNMKSLLSLFHEWEGRCNQ